MSNNKGFTLIEMMIVLVIIGIIASTAYPSVSKARDMSDENERSKHEYVVNKALKEHYALTGAYPDSGEDLSADLAEHTGVSLNLSKYKYNSTLNDSKQVVKLQVDFKK